MPGGMAYADVRAAVPESANVVSDPPRELNMELRAQADRGRSTACPDQRSSRVVWGRAPQPSSTCMPASKRAPQRTWCWRGPKRTTRHLSPPDELKAWVTQGLDELA